MPTKMRSTDSDGYLLQISMRTDTLQQLTYDDFVHIIGNNRSGMVRDLAITDIR